VHTEYTELAVLLVVCWAMRSIVHTKYTELAVLLVVCWCSGAPGVLMGRSYKSS
jgi:membrane protein required for beta-lactamase induction